MLGTQDKEGMKYSSDSDQRDKNRYFGDYIKSFKSLLLHSRLTQATKFFSQVSVTEVREFLSPICFTVQMCWK